MRRLLLLLPIALVGCATTGSSGGEIAIETVSRGQALPGVNCAVNTNSGNWNITTPAIVNVGSANGDLRIVCNKNGYRTAEMIYRPSGPLGSSVGLGVAGGSGNVGVGLGLSMPVALGGSGYPSHVMVDLSSQ